MHTLENVKKISFIFFLVIGIIHITSGLMQSNGYFPEISKLINKTMDIPFIATGLLYGLSSLRLNLARDEKRHTILNTVLLTLGIIIFTAVLIINILIPDISNLND